MRSITENRIGDEKYLFRKKILLAKWVLVCLFIAIPLKGVQAMEKSGVKPSVLSLPSGPGSIEGLGESFEPQLNTGTASYSINFETPPGRAGFSPSIGLAYNNGTGSTVAGLGWKLNLPSLRRQTDKGLPLYTDYPNKDKIDNDFDGEIDEADEWDTIIHSNGEELVPLPDNTFRFENESAFTKFERLQAGGWLATQKNGVKFYYGTSSESQITGPDGEVFKWLLAKMRDTHGNQIEFSHAKLDDSQYRYFKKITYNKDMNVVLEYEKRPDILTDYKPRFELKIAYRLKNIKMKIGEKDIRSYQLRYAPISDTQPLSLLTSVTQFGRDGASSLPPAEFTYTKLRKLAAEIVKSTNSPSVSLNDGNIDLLDINSDGLPDVLDTRDSLHSYYLNKGINNSGQLEWSGRQDMASMPATMYLQADTVQLSDIDGDGHTDMLNVFSNDIQTYKLQKSESNYEWQEGPLLRQTQFNFRNADTRFIDINNDKKIDVMRTNGNDIILWLNDGSQRWSNPINKVLPQANIGLDRATTRFADMNGDRLQDIVLFDNDNCIYYPNKGFGEYGKGISMGNAPFGAVDKSKLLLIDINGDGRADGLRVANGQVFVWINQGLLTSDHSKGAFAPHYIVDAPLTTSTTVMRQADVNGNGSTDLLFNTHPNGADERFVFLDFAPKEQPYLLKSISNGIGLVTTIFYRSSVEDYTRDEKSNKPWPQTVPFPVTVIAKLEKFDGLNTYTTQYNYHDGYYDRKEKEFRGFARVEKYELGDVSAPTLVSHYRYNTGDKIESLKGKLLLLEERNTKNELFFEEIYTWDSMHIASSSNAIDKQVSYALQARKLKTFFEKGQGDPVSLRWDYEYDSYGNLIRQLEHGRLDEGWDDERLTEIVYSAAYPQGIENWILDKPVKQTISDNGGKKYSESEYFYDKNKKIGQLSLANLTEVKSWVNEGKYIEFERKDYDSFGNVVAFYGPLYLSPGKGHYRNIVYDKSYHTFPVEEKIYTGNQILTTGVQYDFGFGKPVVSYDFNGHKTTYVYDTFSRLTAITKPLDDNPTVEYDYVLAHELKNGGVINWVETRQRETRNGGTVDSRKYFDGLSRAIMTRAEGEEPGQIVVSGTVEFNARKQIYRNYLPYFEVGGLDFVEPSLESNYTQHLYDALGREISMTQPDDSFSLTIYEPLRKIIKGEEQTDEASPHYGASMVYVEDGLIKSGKGRLREVHEVTPEVWITKYRYDVLDNFLGYTDSQNNQKIIEYDGLSRNIFMNDPDRGHYYWFYDDASNLIKTIDAKGQKIIYQYDGVNRLIKEFYGVDMSIPKVSYHYDQAAGPQWRGDYWPVGGVSVKMINSAILGNSLGDQKFDINKDNKIDVADTTAFIAGNLGGGITARNLLGSLAWVEDETGEEHLSYDARSRKVWEIKKIVEHGQVNNFFTGYELDSMDRVSQLTYPDGTIISYNYNTRGLLENIPNVIDQYNYNSAGQNTLLSLVNGVTTHYNYDKRLRLSRLHSNRASDNLDLQDLNYTYDKVSNIIEIIDGRSEDALKAIGAELKVNDATALQFNATQNFEYDNLYRLTKAKNIDVYGEISYRYDRIGNLVNKDASKLFQPKPELNLGNVTHGGVSGSWNRIGRSPGDEPGPHAVTTTQSGLKGEGVVAYDDNGNISLNQGAQLSWDQKDRLIHFRKREVFSSYKYDFKNTRVVKNFNERNMQTIYINKYIEIRNGQMISYVYEGSNRVAVNNRSGISINAFYIKDHLGSLNMALDKDSVVVELHDYYPFGSERYSVVNNMFFNSKYRYSKKETDLESNFQYYGARYKASDTGQFINVDPHAKTIDLRLISVPQNLNTYAFVNNRVIIFDDPDGKLLNIIVGAAAAAATSIAFDVAVAVITGQKFDQKLYREMGVNAAVNAAVGGASSGFSVLSKVSKLAKLVKAGSSNKVVKNTLKIATEATLEASKDIAKQYDSSGKIDVAKLVTNVTASLLISDHSKKYISVNSGKSFSNRVRLRTLGPELNGMHRKYFMTPGVKLVGSASGSMGKEVGDMINE